MAGKQIVVFLIAASLFLVHCDVSKDGFFKDRRECHRMIKRIKANMKPLVIDEKNVVMNFTEMLCERFPSKSCKKYKENMDKVLSVTRENFHPHKICSILHPNLQSVMDKLKNTTLLCKGCKLLVQWIKLQITVFNKTEQEVKDGIQRMCDILPLKIQKEICDDITNYMDEIIQQILQGLSPGDICVEMKLCNSTKSFLGKLFNLHKLPGLLENRFKSAVHSWNEMLTKTFAFKHFEPKKLHWNIFRQMETKTAKPTNVDDQLGKETDDAVRQLLPDPNAKEIKDNDHSSDAINEDADGMVVEASEPAFDFVPPSIFSIDQLPPAVMPTDEIYDGTSDWFSKDKITPYIWPSTNSDIISEPEMKLDTDRKFTLDKFDKFSTLEEKMKSINERLKEMGESIIEDDIPSLPMPVNVTMELPETIDEGIGCTACKVVVKFIVFEVKTVNASVEAIEKTVKALCKLYPIKAAEDACDKIVDDIDEIIQLIEKDVQPGDICVKIGLCSSKITATTLLSPTRNCKPICTYFKEKFQEDVKLITKSWIFTKLELFKLCKDDDNSSKCQNLLKIFAKAERQLGNAMKQKRDVGKDQKYCKCFKHQPFFITGETDKCQQCKQIERGLVKDLGQAKLSMDYLASKMDVFCQTQDESKEKCVKIMHMLNTSFSQLETKMMNINSCGRLGYCNKNKNINDGMETALQKFKKMPGGIFNPVLQFMKSFSFGCAFCQSCIEKIEQTISKVNETTTSSGEEQKEVEDMTPALKEGFAIFCHSQGNKDEVTSVCKTISGGMETVKKMVQKKSDLPAVCRAFGEC